MQIKLSEPFAIKYISTIFKPISKGVIPTLYRFLTDSRYREYMKLDKWLQNQYELCDESPILNVDSPLLSSDFSKFYIKFFNSIAAKYIFHQNPDRLIVDILKYVNKNIRYVTDRNNFGYTERWEDLTETVKRKKGDCENMNALIYTMARMAGIPSYLLWCCTGLTTTNEGHYWLLYFSPKKAKFYSIDATYKPNKSYLQYRQPFSIGKNYKKVWFIFNSDFVFRPK